MYGKRAKKDREVIIRECPAIVAEEVWNRAQDTLKANQVVTVRNEKQEYLLKGLIECGHCGLHYTGCAVKRSAKAVDRYYRCNGKHRYRGPLGKCDNKSVKADSIEEIVWNQIESIILNPNLALEKLYQAYDSTENTQTALEAERSIIEKALSEKENERNRILTLYRRGTISLDAVDAQLLQINTEEKHLKEQLENIHAQEKEKDNLQKRMHMAENLIHRLQHVFNNPVSNDIKREVIKSLVWSVELRTEADGDKKLMHIKVKFFFDQNSVSFNRTDEYS